MEGFDLRCEVYIEKGNCIRILVFLHRMFVGPSDSLVSTAGALPPNAKRIIHTNTYVQIGGGTLSCGNSAISHWKIFDE